MSSPFTAVGDDDVARLVAEAPLCWIVPHAAPAAAILMPVLLERDASGRPASLLGHFPSEAPAAAALAGQPDATFLVLGPNSYIPTQTAGRSDWAPTWNFASTKFQATVGIDRALTRTAVEAMVAHMEGPSAWSPAALGPRYEKMLARIVGFRAQITATAPRFKLGQDEDATVVARIAEALGDSPLGRWTRRMTGQ